MLCAKENAVSSKKIAGISIRSSKDGNLAWKTDCLFCGEVCLIDERHPERKKSHKAETNEFSKRILDARNSRDDQLAYEKTLVSLH